MLKNSCYPFILFNHITLQTRTETVTEGVLTFVCIALNFYIKTKSKLQCYNDKEKVYGTY